MRAHLKKNPILAVAVLFYVGLSLFPALIGMFAQFFGFVSGLVGSGPAMLGVIVSVLVLVRAAIWAFGQAVPSWKPSPDVARGAIEPPPAAQEERPVARPKMKVAQVATSDPATPAVVKSTSRGRIRATDLGPPRKDRFADSPISSRRRSFFS